jgi:hypothetical protein
MIEEVCRFYLNGKGAPANHMINRSSLSIPIL